MENGPFIDDVPSFKPPFIRDFPGELLNNHRVIILQYYISGLYCNQYQLVYNNNNNNNDNNTTTTNNNNNI